MAYMSCDYLGSSPKRYLAGCMGDVGWIQCREMDSSEGRESATGLGSAACHPFEKLAMVLRNSENQEGPQEAKQVLLSLYYRTWKS